jgi:hypothetical protein
MATEQGGRMGMIRAAMMTAALMLVVFAGGPRATLAQTPAVPPAQTGSEDGEGGDFTSEIELTRAAIQVRRQALITAVMDLEGKEADAFWPLYRDYRTAMAKVNDRYVKLVVSYLDGHETLTDDAAGQMLNDYLGIERDRTSVKAKYLPRFRKVMPARKVARFFQADSKLDAVISAELARMIPLAR